MNIVLARLERIDRSNQYPAFSNVGSVIAHDFTNEKTIVIDESLHELEELVHSKHQVFVHTGHLLASQYGFENIFVFFDLEVLPFFQKAKEIISNEESQKGVLRYRRMMDEERHSTMAEELFVLSTLFGEPLEVDVLRNQLSIDHGHVIVTVKFAGGALAHLEYTLGHDDQIEFEWSGVKHILEFDSQDMDPVPGSTYPTLTYEVDTILSTSHRADEALLNRLRSYKQLLSGGVEA